MSIKLKCLCSAHRKHLDLAHPLCNRVNHLSVLAFCLFLVLCIYFRLCWVFVAALLIAVTSLDVEHRLQEHKLQQLRLTGLVVAAWRLICPMACGNFLLMWDQTSVPCITRCILNHWATGKPLLAFWIKSLFFTPKTGLSVDWPVLVMSRLSLDSLTTALD